MAGIGQANHLQKGVWILGVGVLYGPSPTRLTTLGGANEKRLLVARARSTSAGAGGYGRVTEAANKEGSSPPTGLCLHVFSGAWTRSVKN